MSENDIVSADACANAINAWFEGAYTDKPLKAAEQEADHMRRMKLAMEASGYPQKVASMPEQCDQATELTRLRADNAALRADAERYRWLCANVQPWECGKYPYALLRIYMREGEKTIDYFQVGQGDGVGRISLDTAIDAAIAASHPEQP